MQNTYIYVILHETKISHIYTSDKSCQAKYFQNLFL